MGDFRAEIQITMTLIGKTYRYNSSINYAGNGEGIDDRIVQWFNECYQDALRRYDEEQKTFWADRDRKAQEAIERQELARLKSKYEKEFRP